MFHTALNLDRLRPNSPLGIFSTLILTQMVFQPPKPYDSARSRAISLLFTFSFFLVWSDVAVVFSDLFFRCDVQLEEVEEVGQLEEICRFYGGTTQQFAFSFLATVYYDL